MTTKQENHGKGRTEKHPPEWMAPAGAKHPSE